MIIGAIQKYIMIGGGVVVAVLLVVIGLLYLQNGSLENDLAAEKLEVTRLNGELNTAVDLANKNAAAAEAIKAERDQTQALLDTVRAKDAARQDEINTITKEVARAKPAECPAGDGLAAAHNGLRKLTAPKFNN
jgi:hypothetical protein